MAANRRSRRLIRIEKEIALLEAMHAKLWRWAWFCAIIYFVAQFSIWFILLRLVMAESWSNSLVALVSLAGATLTAFMLSSLAYGWGMFFTIVVAIIAIMLLELDSLSSIDWSLHESKEAENKKSKLRRRIERAIAIRKSKLQRKRDELGGMICC